MRLNNLIHFYQPYLQHKDVLDQIVHQCYQPLVSGILDNETVSVTININGSLLDLFHKYGYIDLLKDLAAVSRLSRVTFTSSAKYHAFLPLLPEDEIKRQVLTNEETVRHYFGKETRLSGFFAPEMGVNSKVLKILKELGYKWAILDEVSYSGGKTTPKFDVVYRDKSSGMLVVFRNRHVSNLLMSAVVRNVASLTGILKSYADAGTHSVITAMDGETFGHHRIGFDKFFFEMYQAKEIDFGTIAEFVDSFDPSKIKEFEVVPSTWSSSASDIENNSQFMSWSDPDNQIHTWQWELVNLVLKSFYKLPMTNPHWNEIRAAVDVGLASDHFWWASANPWWSVEMIEWGAHHLLQVALMLDRELPDSDLVSKARTLYANITSTSFDWQRSGKIREKLSTPSIIRIPFKERTYEVGGVERGIYEAFIAMMHDQEIASRDSENYEQAILWRDAILKLETKNDIYDAIHAVDLLRQQLPHEDVEKMLDKYTEKYKKIRGGQPEQRDH